VHPTGKPYEVLRGDVSTIASITPDERREVWTLARGFDQMPAHEAFVPREASENDGDRPGDLFNQRTSWGEVLEPHGWRFIYKRGETAYWRRPGKAIGILASTGHTQADTLTVFSTSTPFDTVPVSYSQFAAYAVLNHGGDFAAAGKALWKLGLRKAVLVDRDGESPPPVFEQSDAGNAELFAYLHGKRTRYGDGMRRVETSARGVSSLLSLLSQGVETTREWPDEPDKAAFHGLAGGIVRAIEPHSEADPVALLMNTLLAFGSLVGGNARFLVGATEHYPREFAILVGKTSKARKGDSWSPVRRIFSEADPTWADRLANGLSSGEGLIYAVRDPVVKQKRIKDKKSGPTYFESEVEDEGVEDKRLLVVETEWASLLKVADREKNTVSPIVREAWDSGGLRTMRRKSPLKATGAHISILGHITMEELMKLLTATEAANGFMNRFIITCVQRKKLLPNPTPIDVDVIETLANEIRDLTRASATVGQMKRDAEANDLWEGIYYELAKEAPGMAGAILARGEAHVVRLSMLYALLDGSSVVRAPHLQAAAAVWDYSQRSVAYIFGDAVGNRVADTILRELKLNGRMSMSDSQAVFKNHLREGTRDEAINELIAIGKAGIEQEETEGRPKQVLVLR
jgi:hypothetical protein